MKNKKSLKVGDKIVDFGQVCRIFKIKKQKIFFKPYFKNRQSRPLTYSIPIDSIKKTNIRRPISKRELKGLLKALSERVKRRELSNTTRLRESLRLNDIHQTAKVLKILWIDKNDELINFTKSKKDVLKLAMERLVEEIAFVGSVSIEKAKIKIEEALLKME